MHTNKKILVVDDDLLILEMIKSILSKYGYQVLACSNSDEAMNAITDTSWDLVITDYMMPKKNGLELSKAIQKHTPEIPILVISGNSFKSRKEMHTLNEILGAASEVLGKPFNPHELINIVNDLLEA